MNKQQKRELKEKASKMTYSQLLEQDKWWRTADGRMLKLKKMELSHQLNLLSMLLRKASGFAWELEVEVMKAAASIEIHHGEDIPDGVFNGMTSMEAEADRALMDPQCWMRDRPLYRELRRLVIKRLGGNVPTLANWAAARSNRVVCQNIVQGTMYNGMASAPEWTI